MTGAFDENGKLTGPWWDPIPAGHEVRLVRASDGEVVPILRKIEPQPKTKLSYESTDINSENLIVRDMARVEMFGMAIPIDLNGLRLWGKLRAGQPIVVGKYEDQPR